MNIGSLIRRAVGSYGATQPGRMRGRPRRSAQSQMAGGLFRMLRRKL
jgi:hypothetical protein